VNHLAGLQTGVEALGGWPPTWEGGCPEQRLPNEAITATPYQRFHAAALQHPRGRQAGAAQSARGPAPAQAPTPQRLVPWSLLAGPVHGRLTASARVERRNASLELELRATTRELRASRARIFAAAAQERRRIERDLHDAGQNRLVALRIKLDLAADQAAAEGDSELHATLLELGEEAQEALDAVRAVAHGIYPSLLAMRGLGAALAAEAHEALLPVRVSGGAGVPRSTPDAEAAIWFCCLEAIQNACKHAGRDAHVTVSLACTHRGIEFAVEDDGAGVAPHRLGATSGLTNMRDRVAAVGGTLDVTSAPDAGTCVRGSAPWPSRYP
jgi:signal transduction histidine kinase